MAVAVGAALALAVALAVAVSLTVAVGFIVLVLLSAHIKRFCGLPFVGFVFSILLNIRIVQYIDNSNFQH